MFSKINYTKLNHGRRHVSSCIIFFLPYRIDDFISYLGPKIESSRLLESYKACPDFIFRQRDLSVCALMFLNIILVYIGVLNNNIGINNNTYQNKTIPLLTSRNTKQLLRREFAKFFI